MPRGIAGTALHGTRSRYVHGCRCAECVAANTAYARANQARWSKPCEVEGCDGMTQTGRYCPKHRARISRHGDAELVLTHAVRRGADNNRWTGDDVSYGALHRRIAQERGTPSKCERCGEHDPMRAYQWALDWTRNPEVVETPFGPISLDVMAYARLCVPCHKRMDLGRSYFLCHGRRDLGSDWFRYPCPECNADELREMAIEMAARA